MSRGVVLWPDAEVAAVVRAIWDELVAAGLPSCATHTHRLHQPHVSLIVGEHLPVEAALTALGSVPSSPVRLQIESVAFFPQGAMILPLVMNNQLQTEQQRVHRAISPLIGGVWPHSQPDEWTPHITCAYGLSRDDIATASHIALAHLPLTGYLDRGGVEDGTTGESWS